MSINQTYLFKNTDQFLLDSYTGEGGFLYGATNNATPQNYLIRHVSEENDEFSRRTAFSVYPNFCRKIIDTYIGYLWEVKPSRSNLKTGYQDFVNNASGTGLSLDAVLEDYHKLALIMGTVFIIVDKSSIQAISKADEQLPYLTSRFPCQLKSETKDRLGSWESVTFSETINNEEQFRTFTKTDWIVSRDDKATDIISQGKHNLGVVPVVKLHVERPLNPMNSRSKSFYYDIAIINWDIFNKRSEMRQLERDQTFALLTIPTPTNESKESASQLVIGSKNALGYNPLNGGKPDFIAPPPTSIAAYRQDIIDDVQMIYQLANIEFVGGVQSSGTALAFQFRQANSRLSTIANMCKDAELEIKRLVSFYLKENNEGTVSYNNKFDLINLAQDLSDALDAVSLDMGQEFNAELKKRTARKILGNDTASDIVKKIDNEIDAQGDIYGDKVKSAGL